MIGHWESNVVTTLNDQLLESAGSRWDDWLPITNAWAASGLREEYLDRAVDVLRGEYGASLLFVLKDPRICRLAPLWLEALARLEVRTVVAMMVRSPVEVAESLAARDGSEPGQGLLVWLRNALDAEIGSRGVPRHVFSFDGLLKDWRAVVENMEGATGVVWPRKSVLTASEVDAFLMPNERHQEYDSKTALGSKLPIWVRETYAILSKWCMHGEDSADHAMLDKIRMAFDASAPTFAQLITQGTVRGEGVGEAARKRQYLENEVAQLTDELAQITRREEATSAALASAELSAQTARNNCDELERALAATTVDRDHNISLQKVAAEECERLSAELAQVRFDAAALRAQADETHGDLKNRLSKSESALLQRQEEARQSWAEASLERRINEMLRADLQRAQASHAGLEERYVDLERRLQEQVHAVFAADLRALEAEWATKAASQRESNALERIGLKQAELDMLTQEQRGILGRLADKEAEIATLIGLQLELEKALLAATQRVEAAERLVDTKATPEPADPLAENQHAAVLAKVARQQGEIAKLTSMAIDEVERLRELSSRAEWLRDFSELQQRTPRWWTLLPAKEKLRRLRAKLEASGKFDGAAYMMKYPDVAESRMDPLIHYVRHGIFESRSW